MLRVLLVAAIVALALAVPQVAAWWVDQAWRRRPQYRRCTQCGRSWWWHTRDGCIVTCPKR